MKVTKKNHELSDEASTALPNLQEIIERRAYELYQERGCGDNDALSDWFRAEAEIKAAQDAYAENKAQQVEKLREKPRQKARSPRAANERQPLI